MANPKEVAGRRAAAEVRDGMKLGLGTGSTVDFTLIALAERIQSEGLGIAGVPTSKQTELRCQELGIPLLTLEDVTTLDLAIDGADRIDPGFSMVKGGGGALLREKVVASLASRVVIVVGPDKLAPKLGVDFALPVEVVPFALPVVRRRLEAELGCTVVERQKDGGSYRTDNGNAILDCTFIEGIADPAALEARLNTWPGVVENGLFVDLCHAYVLGYDDGEHTFVERPG